MSFKCNIGLHNWNGCKCSECEKIREEQHNWSGCKCTKCGKTRDEQHNWTKDCEKCSNCGKILVNAHKWLGCKCTVCGKIRDEQHDWSKDCERCSKCGKVLVNAHKWSGCKCSDCGKTRDEQHTWSGCKCTICEKTRDEQHTWLGCKCTICGKTRDEQHTWSGYECTVCEKAIAVDKDGKEYKSVKIGNQVWISENLNVEHYRNGDLIPQVQDKDEWDELITGAWCYFNNDPATGKTLGKLYNWYAVNDPRGLAPDGWHIPSDVEWTLLTDYLGGEEVAGGKLKSTALWDSPNTGATNSSGFTALPCNTRYIDFWSTTETVYNDARFYGLLWDRSGVTRNSKHKEDGLFVRCVKDLNMTFNEELLQMKHKYVRGISESTSIKPKSEKTIVTDKSGNVYKTVKIGSQEWTTENLNVEHYRNGDLIPQVQDAKEWAKLTTGAWCYYNNEKSKGRNFGKLYNWYAVNDPRGLAPEGWHVPSDAEWTQLTDYLGGVTKEIIRQDGVKYWFIDNVGEKLKATALWFGLNNKATNEIGFTAFPGGMRPDWNDFCDIHQLSYFWSSLEFNSDKAWYRHLYWKMSGVVRNFDNKMNGLSVRCVKN
jgi:uncharacterized protein (TIGR02145 family)